MTTDLHRGLAVVIRTGTSLGAEAVAAELLRTRLLERGIAVEVACPAKCLEISLIEFLAEGASGSALAPGQVLNAPTGAVPGLSGLTRAPSDRERAARPAALLVTFSARDGNRFLARSHVVAILAAETR